MYAKVTDQGTAMSETAICSKCVPQKPLEFVDATGNDYLECNECGWPWYPDDDDEENDQRISELTPTPLAEWYLATGEQS